MCESEGGTRSARRARGKQRQAGEPRALRERVKGGNDEFQFSLAPVVDPLTTNDPVAQRTPSSHQAIWRLLRVESPRTARARTHCEHAAECPLSTRRTSHALVLMCPHHRAHDPHLTGARRASRFAGADVLRLARSPVALR